MMERKEEKIPFFTVWFAMEKKNDRKNILVAPIQNSPPHNSQGEMEGKPVVHIAFGHKD